MQNFYQGHNRKEFRTKNKNTTVESCRKDMKERPCLCYNILNDIWFIRLGATFLILEILMVDCSKGFVTHLLEH
jgi:hypothetical protein